MPKIIDIGRILAFLVTLVTTIPLFINYILGTSPKNQLIVHLHVWFGLLFFIFAIISMILQKRMSKNNTAAVPKFAKSCPHFL